MPRAALRDTTALAVGSLLSGVLAYVFFGLVTRGLGAAEAAPVSVLWTYWSAAAAIFTFPLQHWIARTVAAEQGEGGVRRAARTIATVVLGAAVLAGALAWLGRSSLFHRSDAMFPALVAGVTIGSGFVGVVRGGLAARRQFLSVAWALVAENGVRCAIAAALVAADVRRAGPYGLALVAGPLIGLQWLPAIRFGRERSTPVMGSPFAFLGGIAGGSLIGQGVLTSGPVILSLLGGQPAQVTSLFAGLALFRAPYTLALGLVTQVTGRLSTLVAQGRDATLRRLRVLAVACTAAAAVGASVVGGAVGNDLLRLVFGTNVTLPATLIAAVAGGSAIALANLVMSLFLVARGRGAPLARAWGIAAAAGVLMLLLPGLSPLEGVVWAFVVAEAVALAAMVLSDARSDGGDVRSQRSRVDTHTPDVAITDSATGDPSAAYQAAAASSRLSPRAMLARGQRRPRSGGRHDATSR